MGLDRLIDKMVLAKGKKAYGFKGSGWFGNYDLVDRKLPSYEPILDELKSHLSKERLKEPVLDLASGLGGQADYLEKLGIKTVRFDLSNDALKNVQGNMWELPFKSLTFAGVHVKDGLVHVLDKRKFVAEVTRVLVPGGVLCITSDLSKPPVLKNLANAMFSGSVYVSFDMDDLQTIAKDFDMRLIREHSWAPEWGEADWYSDKRMRTVAFFKKKRINNFVLTGD
ncbi:class I SAM-dependent methyltransferase [Candidatus Collierbacteria bacterium]|nr:class I SAM-dependent methyltransferase [Candidatus Collierbacteria bacterium]